jgi:hypothetical protein
MNDLTIRTDVKGPVSRTKLPMEAHQQILDALASKLTELYRCRSRIEAMVSRWYDLNGRYAQPDPSEDRQAVCEQANALRATIIAEQAKLPLLIEAGQNMLATWAPSRQIETLAGMVGPAALSAASTIDLSWWLNAVYIALKCERTAHDPDDEFNCSAHLVGGEPLCPEVLAKAVIALVCKAKFVPSPAEFGAACRAERRRLSFVVDALAKLARKEVPVLAPPAIAHAPEPKQIVYERLNGSMRPHVS